MVLLLLFGTLIFLHDLEITKDKTHLILFTIIW